jgi:hypothetical protein
MFHSFVNGLDYNNHNGITSNRILSGLVETRISKCKRCSEKLRSPSAGFHLGYRLPRYLLAYYTTLSSLSGLIVLHIKGRCSLSRVRCGCDGVHHGGRCLQLLELVDLGNEISNLIIPIHLVVL